MRDFPRSLNMRVEFGINTNPRLDGKTLCENRTSISEQITRQRAMVTISRSLIFMEISLTHTTTSTFKTELKPKVQRNGRTYNTVITTRPNLPQNASSGAKNQSAVVFMPRNNLQKFDSAKNTTLFTCIQQNTSRVFSNIFGKLFIRYSLRQSSRLARPGLDHDLATFSSSWELKYLTLS